MNINWHLAQEWVTWASAAVWRSLVAAWRTTAVWTAMAVVAVGMFVLGHVEGARGKQELRDEVRVLAADKAKLIKDRDFAFLEKRKAEESVAEMAAKLASPAKPVAPHPAKAARPAKPKSEDATSWWGRQ